VRQERYRLGWTVNASSHELATRAAYAALDGRTDRNLICFRQARPEPNTVRKRLTCMDDATPGPSARPRRHPA
jgi:hypothetical protein